MRPLSSSRKACVGAHGAVVMWNSWTGFVSGSIISLFLNPACGRLSDCYGRKNLLIMGAVANLLPLLALAAYANLRVTSLFTYYAASTICDGFSNSVSSISQAYIADKMAPYNRAGAFSLLMGVMSLALLLGPAVGASMPSADWCDARSKPLYMTPRPSKTRVVTQASELENSASAVQRLEPPISCIAHALALSHPLCIRSGLSAGRCGSRSVGPSSVSPI